MDLRKGQEQLDPNEASKLLDDLCVQTVRLSGQGLVLADSSAGGGRSNDIILSCCWKTIASVLEAMLPIQNKVVFFFFFFFSLHCVSLIQRHIAIY